MQFKLQCGKGTIIHSSFVFKIKKIEINLKKKSHFQKPNTHLN